MPEPSRPDDIEELMKMLGVDPSGVAPTAPPPAAESPDTGGTTRLVGPPPAPPPARVEAPPSPPPAPPLPPPPLPELPTVSESRPPAGLEMLGDVNVQVRVELGRSRLAVQEVLRLSPGAVVPLESLTRDPLDVYVNDQLVARGEAVVAGEGFAVRITEVLAPPVRPPAP